MSSKSIVDDHDSKATKKRRTIESIEDADTSARTFSLDSRSSCEIDLRSARKQWPLFDISLKSGLLVVTSTSTTDVLAEAANEYTATFAKKHATLLQCLLNSVFDAKHRDTTVKYLKTVLEAEAGLIGYLIISILLAFTKVTLVDTVAEILRRLTGTKPEAGMLLPVSAKYRLQATGLFTKDSSKSSAQSMDETVLFHLLSDLVKSQESKIKTRLRQANVLAETNQPIVC